MVVLVCCTDNTFTVALESRLESLASEGLITAYLGPDGWVAAKSKKNRVKGCPQPAERRRYTAFVSCF
ncbi:MAG: hypothetical protein A2075_13080 [Geobacteraceae bacterium GWC2_58_44]|nr:MAG: hypothetical protein A2075_13080 [Geobacteraceae bacterium GWC2_58_44]HBG06445.1 hypothetical protein [Geobacter sp.]